MNDFTVLDNSGDLARAGAAGFVELLRRRCGTITAAWRLILDRDGTGRMSFAEFCQACRDLGYNGNLKSLWRELDDDKSGFISLAELDPEAAMTLRAFRRLLRDKCGSTLEGWHFLDKDKKHRVDATDFQDRMDAMGHVGSTANLFKYLQTDMGRKYLTIADIDKDAQHADQRGDTKMVTFRDKIRKSMAVSAAIDFGGMDETLAPPPDGQTDRPVSRPQSPAFFLPQPSTGGQSITPGNDGSQSMPSLHPDLQKTLTPKDRTVKVAFENADQLPSEECSRPETPGSRPGSASSILKRKHGSTANSRWIKESSLAALEARQKS
jgi:Ca2+-binding EF-hand superfamily protein